MGVNVVNHAYVDKSTSGLDNNICMFLICSLLLLVDASLIDK